MWSVKCYNRIIINRLIKWRHFVPYVDILFRLPTECHSGGTPMKVHYLWNDIQKEIIKLCSNEVLDSLAGTYGY